MYFSIINALADRYHWKLVSCWKRELHFENTTDKPFHLQITLLSHQIYIHESNLLRYCTTGKMYELYRCNNNGLIFKLSPCLFNDWYNSCFSSISTSIFSFVCLMVVLVLSILLFADLIWFSKYLILSSFLRTYSSTSFCLSVISLSICF